MANRKGISPSLRWSVLSRDAFTCRYCGAQAGQTGVELAVDHIVSVADGGDDRISNLATAFRKCNGGKGAKSLKVAPSSNEVVERIQNTTVTMNEQALAISASIKAQRVLDRLAVNLKCEAYGCERCHFAKGEAAHITKLCQSYGADLVLGWYKQAADRGIKEHSTIKYVYGIVRNIRRQREESHA